jgi:hypothetical protein
MQHFKTNFDYGINICYTGDGIAQGYELDDREVGVRVSVESRIIFSPLRSDWLWGPLSLLFNRYWGLSPRG